jgi:hypothetical protein
MYYVYEVPYWYPGEYENQFSYPYVYEGDYNYQYRPHAPFYYEDLYRIPKPPWIPWHIWQKIIKGTQQQQTTKPNVHAVATLSPNDLVNQGSAGVLVTGLSGKQLEIVVDQAAACPPPCQTCGLECEGGCGFRFITREGVVTAPGSSVKLNPQDFVKQAGGVLLKGLTVQKIFGTSQTGLDCNGKCKIVCYG